VALERCNGEYVGIVQSGLPIKDMWIENPLYALINNSVGRQGFEIEGSTEKCWGAVVRKEDLQFARRNFPGLSVPESLKVSGIMLRHPETNELPFQFDNLLQEAHSAEGDGNWSEAAQIFECIANHNQNELWMKRLAAKAFFKAAEYGKAAELSQQVNQQRPTVEMLLLEAKVKRKQEKLGSAIELLRIAEQMLSDPHWSIQCKRS
jgi:hypothetical protein